MRFPDARLEYEDRDGWSRHEDIEVVTSHYCGAHAGAAAGRASRAIALSEGSSAGAVAAAGARRIPESPGSSSDEAAA